MGDVTAERAESAEKTGKIKFTTERAEIAEKIVGTPVAGTAVQRDIGVAGRGHPIKH